MSVERLGSVTIPSGRLMIVDTGLLNLWSHDRAPLLPEYERIAAAANSAIDFRIEGPDAEAAGRAFDRQWNPRFVFDIPAHGVDAVKASFASIVKAAGLQASLVEGPRIPHLERVDLVLKLGQGAGEVQFHGVPGVVISGLPKNRELTVFGERVGEAPFEQLWRTVTLEVQPNALVKRTIDAGTVAVDFARLMFVDVDGLGGWNHHDSVDDKADVVFWGRDAAEVAEKFAAEQLSSSEFGWKNLQIDVAIDRGQRIEKLKADGALKFAFDFRPHSDHFRLLEQMRSAPTESGTIALGNSLACGFFTSWGDGFFPVRVGLDSMGEVVNVEIALATAQAVANMKAVNGLE